MLVRRTIHALAAGALLAGALPAFADHGRWDRGHQRYGWEDRRPARTVIVERPVYVERRVVVERPVYVDRPVYVERPEPVYGPVYEPAPVYGPVYEPAPVYEPGPVGYPRAANPVKILLV